MADVSATLQQRQPTGDVWSRLTLGDAAMALVVAAAAALRFVDLGRLPLLPLEATAALPAWQLTHGLAVTGDVASPAYLSLTTLLALATPLQDATVRAVPAVFGLALVGLPWLARARLGPIAALVAALMLAVSPLATAMARMAGGDSQAIFAVALAAVSWWQYQESGAHVWFYALVSCLALGIVSSPLFYSGLVTGAAAWWLEGRSRRAETAVPAPRPNAGLWRLAATGGGILLAGLGTVGLWYLPAIGGAATILGDWVQGFGFNSGTGSLAAPFQVLARYELLLLALAAAAVLWTLRRSEPGGGFFLMWAALVFGLLVLRPGDVSLAALVTLPASMLVGLLAQDVLGRRRDRLTWFFGLGLTLMGALVFVNMARFTRVVTFNPQNLNNVWLALFAFVFTVVTIYFLWSWDEVAARQGVLTAALALTLFFQWGTAWWLGHEGATDPRAGWAPLPAADDDVRLLAQLLTQVSVQATGTATDLEVFSSVDSPVLAWYLRQFPRLVLGQSVPVGRQPGVVIAMAGADPALGDAYLGSDFGLLRTGAQAPDVPSSTPWLDTARWWLFHETASTIVETRVVAWVRADLVPQ